MQELWYVIGSLTISNFLVNLWAKFRMQQCRNRFFTVYSVLCECNEA